MDAACTAKKEANTSPCMIDIRSQTSADWWIDHRTMGLYQLALESVSQGPLCQAAKAAYKERLK